MLDATQVNYYYYFNALRSQTDSSLRTYDKVFLNLFPILSQVILSIVGFVVVAITVNPYFILPLLVLGVLFAFVRIVFLRTMQNLKRLEGASELKES